MVTSPVLRYAPGLSLTAQKTATVKTAVFINGDWFGAVTNVDKADTSLILDYTTFALPYIMTKRNDVLILRAGTGIDVAHALSRGAEKVVAVEPNSLIVSTLKKNLRALQTRCSLIRKYLFIKVSRVHFCLRILHIMI